MAMVALVACQGGARPSTSTAPAAVSPSSRASAQPRTQSPTPATLTPVRVQLRWTLGAEFAGYVAAIDQGYFESAGLDVTLLEGAPDIRPEVVGSAVDGPEFTVSWVPAVLVARAAGSSDLVDIGQVFHRSSTLTMAFREQEITSPADFKDRTVGVLPGADRLEVTAAAAGAGLDLEDEVELVDLGTSVEPLLSGDVEVAQVTIHDTYAAVLETTDPHTGQPYEVTDFDVMTVEDEGTAMLQDAIFARGSWLAESDNEAIAAAFLKAVAQGWIHCRDHPADCVASVVAAGETTGPGAQASPSAAPSEVTSDAESRLRPGHEAWAMNEVNPLVWPSPAGVGVMIEDEWEDTVDVLMRSGAIPAIPSDESYRTDLMGSALGSIADLDTTGEAFVKGTVEISPTGRS